MRVFVPFRQCRFSYTALPLTKTALLNWRPFLWEFVSLWSFSGQWNQCLHYSNCICIHFRLAAICTHDYDTSCTSSTSACIGRSHSNPSPITTCNGSNAVKVDEELHRHQPPSRPDFGKACSHRCCEGGWQVRETVPSPQVSENFLPCCYGNIPGEIQLTSRGETWSPVIKLYVHFSGFFIFSNAI